MPVEQRSMAMGIAAAAGSFGQFIMLPATLQLIGQSGWAGALMVLSLLALLLLPLAFMMKDVAAPDHGPDGQPAPDS